MACRALRVPNTTMFDYEYARLQHGLNCRLAKRVLMPDAIPAERVAGYGARPPKLVTYPGLKEEYYLADFEPDPAVPGRWGWTARLGLVLRPPADVALVPPVRESAVRRAAGAAGPPRRRPGVVLPRTPEQAERIRALALPALRGARAAVDGQSLVAGADLVVSAGGTMNREAVVLGTPVYTTFAGRMGGVDERLIAEGRLRSLERMEDLVVERKPQRSATGSAATPSA